MRTNMFASDGKIATANDNVHHIQHVKNRTHAQTFIRSVDSFVFCSARASQPAPLAGKNGMCLCSLCQFFPCFFTINISSTVKYSEWFCIYTIIAVVFEPQRHGKRTNNVDFSFHFWRHHNFHVRKQYMFIWTDKISILSFAHSFLCGATRVAHDDGIDGNHRIQFFVVVVVSHFYFTIYVTFNSVCSMYSVNI